MESGGTSHFHEEGEFTGTSVMHAQHAGLHTVHVHLYAVLLCSTAALRKVLDHFLALHLAVLVAGQEDKLQDRLVKLRLSGKYTHLQLWQLMDPLYGRPMTTLPAGELKNDTC